MKKKILMVDDDPELLAIFARVLELENDWEFHGAQDSKQAFAKVQSVKPDVVILDFDLGPGEKSGLDILKQLRSDEATSKLPVLMFTGVMIDSPDRAAGLDLGADDYVLKPVSPPVLLAKAGAAIRRAAGA